MKRKKKKARKIVNIKTTFALYVLGGLGNVGLTTLLKVF